MAGKGRSLNFHGIYAQKEDAKRKEREIDGAFVLPVKVGGRTHYAVVTTRKSK